jgi:5,10-methylene-tetrahydrofolate dehydrogenase/methenyl tetrahydrofolate cyclohydrolase
MVGDRGDSKSYVESKKKACADVGFESYHTTLSGNISEELLLKVSERTLPT